MRSGKTIRLDRLSRDGRFLLAALDHGVTNGPIIGLSSIQSTISAVAQGGATGVILHKGLLREGLVPRRCGLIVHMSASTALSRDPDYKVIVTTVDEAVSLGADAVSMHVNLGSRHEADMLRDLGSSASRCREFGVPLLAMMYVRRKPGTEDKTPESVAHAARVAAELGADIVKVSFPGSGRAVNEVVTGCPIPVLIAGGPRVAWADAISVVKQALDGGAAGISFGRNVFEQQDIPHALDALVNLVFPT